MARSSLRENLRLPGSGGALADRTSPLSSSDDGSGEPSDPECIVPRDVMDGMAGDVTET